MSLFWIVLLPAALASAALGWQLRRRALRRREGCRRRFAALLAERRPELALDEAENGRWRLQRGAAVLAEVDGKALTRAAADGGERRRRLFLAVADAAERGPRPLAEPFDLKRHGAATLPRLADEGLALLALDPPAVRYAAPDAAGVETLYLADGEPRSAYLGAEHLAGAGIDARDLHGVALAVLRQRFEESEIRAALADQGVLELEPPDGCGGSRLLLLPELLGEDERLFAAIPSPALLLACADRDRLEAALAAHAEPPHPLPPAVFMATAGGLTRES